MNWHEFYDVECSERMAMPALNPPCLSPQTYRERLMVETAYRRGYCQGWDASLRMPPPQAARHLLDRLLPWRWARHDGKFCWPPE